MIHNDSVMKQYEAVLRAVKAMTKADDCSIFLLDSELGMDEEEKKEVFDDRFQDIYQENKNYKDTPYHKFLDEIKRDETDKYSILTFFVGTGDYWRLESYKTRPHKYIVFNWSLLDGSNQNIPIIKEGITAFTTRTGESLALESRPYVDQHKAFSGKNEGPNLVHDNCCQVAIIPIKDEKSNIVGAIRCDIYELARKPEFRQQTLNQLKGVNDILCKIIHIGKKAEASYSYSKLFHGINILENLKEIQSRVTDNTDKNVYHDTKKLFYVLKRRRYFGEEAIIDRVMGYIKDVCDTLSLDKNPIASLLESFRKHEDLMLYSSVNYRDHFMHQFHVFVVGYIILHYIGLERVANILNNKIIKLKDDKLTEKHILRIWFLSSIFHDCSYLLPEFDKNIGKFLTEILEAPSNTKMSDNDKFKFSVNLKWDQLTKAGFLQELSKIAEYLQVKHQSLNVAAVSAELSQLMFEREHGILGAVIMLQKMSHADTWKENTLYDIEKYVAALAIALHMPKAYERIRAFLGKPGHLFFENCPIMFLLSYCDFLQEWGRKSTNKAKELGTPIFHSLSHNEHNQSITCKLVYTPDSFQPGQTVPSKVQIEKWARSLQDTFKSINFGFAVEYYHSAKTNPRPEDLRKPIYEPPLNLKSFERRQRIRNQCEQFYSLLDIYSKIDNGIDAYFTDFSCDYVSGKCDIGFGTNTEIKIGSEVNVNFNYGGTDLSGKYLVKRIDPAREGLSFTRFVGVEKVR